MPVLPKVFISEFDELNLIKSEIERELLIRKVGYLGDFADLEAAGIEEFTYPAFLALSARLFNGDKEIVIKLSCIMQFIHVASRIHADIAETTANTYSIGAKKEYQFPVLVGDYLYGKFFSILSETAMLENLKLLSDLICSISEGAILRNKRSNITYKLAKEIVHKETAAFYSICAYLGALVSNAGDENITYMRDFGLNFGFGCGLLEWDMGKKDALKHFDKAKSILDKVDCDNLSAKQKFFAWLDKIILLYT